MLWISCNLWVAVSQYGDECCCRAPELNVIGIKLVGVKGTLQLSVEDIHQKYLKTVIMRHLGLRLVKEYEHNYMTKEELRDLGK
jgi:hypothetical protein